MILVTGASGYVGQRLLPLLKSHNGDSPVITAGRDLHVHDRHLDLRNPTGCRKVTEGVQTLIHCAGLAHDAAASADYDRVNVQASLVLADSALASGVKRFIYISSMNVVNAEARDPHLAVTSLPCPSTPYAASKWHAERGLETLLRDTSCELCIVRPALIYDRELTGNLARLASLARLIPARFPDTGHRSMVCREDLVGALSEIVEQPFGAAGVQRYALWDGQHYSARRIADAIVGPRPMRLPTWLWRLAASMRDSSRRAPAGSTWAAIGEKHWIGSRGVEPVFGVHWHLESRLAAPTYLLDQGSPP